MCYNKVFPQIKFYSFLIILTSAVTVTAGIHSRVNRYSLSTEYLEEIANSVHSADSVFYSDFSTNYNYPSLPSLLKIKTEKQDLQFNMHGVLGSEGELPQLYSFGAVGSNIHYQSPFIRANVDVNVFTTKHDNSSIPSENEYERFYPSLSSEHIDGAIDFNFLLKEAWLELFYKKLSLTVGKKKVRWGPGYKGSLALSGNALSPFYYYYLNYSLGSIFNISSFLSGYEDEAFYSDEVEDVQVHYKVKSNSMAVSSLPARYTAAHRLDFRFGKHFQLGIYELVTFFGSNELNRFANPLQIYYLGNDVSGTNNSNLMGGMDFNIIFNPIRVYGEFLNDDITVFQTTGNPNKYAFQLGASFYPKNSAITAIGIEYLHVQPYVYGHSRILSRLVNWNESTGWSYGNDQDIVTGYGRFTPIKNLEIRAEASFWILGKGTIENDWYTDGSPYSEDAPFFPVNPNHLTTVQVGAKYKLFDHFTFDISLRPKWYDLDFSMDIYGYIIADIPNIKTITKID